jgi:carbonic anhydrase
MDHFSSIHEIIIFGHENCGYYKTIPNKHHTKDREENDLSKAIEAIHKNVGEIKVKAFYASFADDNHTEIVFKKAH